MTGAIMAVMSAIAELSVMTGDPPVKNTFRCIIPFWLGEIGFTIMLSSLALKLLRVYFIFCSKNLEVISVRDYMLFLGLVIIILLHSVLLIMITVFTQVEVDFNTDVCKSTLYTPQTSPWAITLQIINIFIKCLQSFASLWLLEKTMFFPKLYTESYYTASVVFIIIAIAIFFVIMKPIHITKVNKITVISLYNIFLPFILTGTIMYPKFQRAVKEDTFDKKKTSRDVPELLKEQKMLEQKIIREVKKKNTMKETLKKQNDTLAELKLKRWSLAKSIHHLEKDAIQLGNKSLGDDSAHSLNQ